MTQRGHDHGHGHGHDPEAGHGHGHGHDRGVRAAWRYARLLPRLWRSPVSNAVVDAIDPSAGERVVDLGAGMGPATVRAARTGAHVVAVDPTPFMRRVLRMRRLVSRHRGRIEVTDGAAEAIPGDDGSVDALWTVNAIHHWTDRAQAIAEITRVLRPGGRAVLVDEDFADPAHPWHERFSARRAKHRHEFDDVEPVQVAAQFVAAGCRHGTGSIERVGGRPAKVIRLTR